MKEPTDYERREFRGVVQRLRSEAGNDFATADLPGRTVSGFINHATPCVRDHIRRNMEMLDHIDSGGRSEPFQPPLTRADVHSPSDELSDRIVSKFRTEELSHGLIARMAESSPAPAPTSGPASIREALSASFDIQGVNDD